MSQALSLALVLVCGALLLYESRREHPAEKLFVNRVAAAENAAAAGVETEHESAAESEDEKSAGPAEIAEPEQENAVEAGGPAEIGEAGDGDV